MAGRLRKRRGNSGLLSRLNLPIFVLIVTFIALFATAASYILIRVQNVHTAKMAEQSMNFVYRNVWYQFDTMNNVAAFVISNQSIENLLENEYKEPYEAVSDYFALQTNLQNLSLLSLLNDFGSREVVQQSYVVSIALEPESGLYELATDNFYPITGIFKAADLYNGGKLRGLSSGERQSLWWGELTNRASGPMIYLARKKASIKDGRSIGTVIIGASARSIKSVFDNAPLEKGYHLLLDQNDRVIFSERYSFLESVGELPYVQAIVGSKGSIVKRIDGEKQRVMFDTLENGWRLLTVVPESHFNKYTFAISGIGAATAAAALLVAGFWLRRIVVRVTVPITRLVAAIQRPEVAEFKEPLPYQDTGIYEVDELNQKFASMLVTLHSLIENSFKEEMERRALQLELLHAQINPHFLYNTLDLINCRAIMAGDLETGQIVRSLANVFRYGLNRGETWISLEEEIIQVEAYLHIQQMMLEQLQVVIQVPGELLSARIVHLTLQPLAENAIVHGFADHPAECRITISVRLDGRKLVLRVEDNGRGCDAAAMNRRLMEQPAGTHGDLNNSDQTGGKRNGGSGFGTMNVHRRIQLHCGKAYGLRYLDVSGGTCVEIVLPYPPDQMF
ncbi:two-component system sensor histidine kinase YesM [Paenibacillus castaneae]|uniref:sensor histidine kinase n=1 Tax=Paenibacillus castaneae TaxID=474957 RepID=UPI00141AFE66|nr:histidine kinase [Paenibacillus castaneae]NIK78591.1 two-component system sensor histidine kinase YesM [Paenibacillus castaneae]